jgi:UDP-glucuronate decarboxylase
MIENHIVQEDMEYIAQQFSDYKRFANKTILITGAGGFIGYYFTQFFLYLMQRRGVKIKSILLLDHFLMNTPSWIKNIEDERIIVRKFDISQDHLDQVTGACDANYIIHLASIASPVYYRQYPLETVEANIFGLKRLLDYYYSKQIDSFLYMSSSEVYGDPFPHCIPTSELFLGNVSTMGPRACYDEAKRFGETLCYIYHQKHQVPIRIVRPFNNYGPGMRENDQRVPADFAKNVHRGEDIILYSNGTPTRTFCYVADAIVGYLKVLTHHSFDCFNIGNDKPEISIKDFAEIYRDLGVELTGYKGNIRFSISDDAEYLQHNPQRRCPDITKARVELGFQPQIGVELGVKRFLQYMLATMVTG